MTPHGIKASELVKKLQEAIKKHGDQEVFKQGGDYTEGVKGLLEKSPDYLHAYVSKGSFYLY